MKKNHVLQEVKHLHWAIGRDCTFMGSLEAVLDFKKINIGYDELMGISGMAYRVAFHPSWCPSTPDASCGFNSAENILNELKIKHERVIVNREDKEEIKEAKSKIVESIDKGNLVIALDLKVAADYGVIAGYEDGGDRLLCRTYYDSSKEYSYAERFPWMIWILEDFTKIPPLENYIRQSIKYISYFQKHEKIHDYYCGHAAYEYWIFELKDEEKFDEPRVDEERMHPNAWIYTSLIDAKMSLDRFLHKYRKEFKGIMIDEIIDYNKRIIELLKKGRDFVKFPHELKPENWTHEHRRQQAKVLEEVLHIEKEIYSLIK